MKKLQPGLQASKRALLTLVCSLTVALCTQSQAEHHTNLLPKQIRFKHVIPQSEEFVGEIIALHQDKYGFIWIGGKDGLARYDGYDYKIFRHAPEDDNSISNNVINDIEEDAKGNLWLATDVGLNYYDRNTQSFTRYVADQEKSDSLNHNRVISLLNENDEFLWIGGDEGLHRMDLREHIIKRYPFTGMTPSEMQLISQYVMGIQLVGNKMYLATGYGLKVWDRQKNTVKVVGGQGKPIPQNMPSRIVRAVLVDSQSRVWVGTELGLTLFNEAQNTFQFYPNPTDVYPGESSAVWKIIEDSQGDIWAVTDGSGISRLPKGEDRLINYVANNRDSFSPTNTVIRTVIEDSVGDLWFGAYPGGVDSVTRYNATFRSYRNITDDNTSISANGVAAILEDEQGNLWVGTEGGGLNYFNSETETYSYINHIPGDNSTIGGNAIMQIYKDGDTLWLALWNGGVSRYNLKTHEVTNYPAKGGSPDHLQIAHVFSILKDSRGDLWVGTMGGGLSKYNKERDVFNSFVYDQEIGGVGNPERIWSITEGSAGYLWLGTHDGLVRVDTQKGTSIRYRHAPHNDKSLSNSWVTSVVEDKKGRLWVATHGGGLNLFDRTTESFERVQKKDGLGSDLIYAMLEDDDGLIWLSSNKGLVSYQPEIKKIRNYSAENGLQSNQFNLGAAEKCANGDLVFGGANGYTRFNPRSLTPNTNPPPVVFSNILVQENPVEINPKGVIEKNILLADKITLTHTQNVFSIDFSALNYRISGDNQYAYWLEGFDSDWQYAGNKRTKSYTNLDAGFYTFRVKASNNEGVWNEVGSAIKIEVIPPPWRTWWAYSLYVLFVVAVITWYVRSQKKVIAVQNSMMSQLQQVDKLKDEFVASTSHELRTPLFGIVGLAETLLEETFDRLTPAESHNMEMIIASGKRLVTQVNDILDYAKIRNNALEVSIKPINLYELCRMVIPLTEQIIGNKDLKLVNKVKSNLPAVMADPHRLQQILINLIANAIHHTHNGRVTVDANVVNNKIQISIMDTGKGIPKDKYDELFEQFTQLENVNSREQKGTGLGLPITKKLVELQKGKIWVNSAVNIGSTFTFTLPITYESVSEITISEAEKTRINVLSVRNASESTRKRISRTVESDITLVAADDEVLPAHVLIVDDEKVNRMVLSAYLKNKPYTISEAESGDEALEILQNDTSIDVVLLDLMMPGMSGFEACEIMRRTHPHQNLPIIFTTAKGNIDDMEHAFAVGGSDFLNKPVDRKELCARVSLHVRLLHTCRQK